MKDEGLQIIQESIDTRIISVTLHFSFFTLHYKDSLCESLDYPNTCAEAFSPAMRPLLRQKPIVLPGRVKG